MSWLGHWGKRWLEENDSYMTPQKDGERGELGTTGCPKGHKGHRGWQQGDSEHKVKLIRLRNDLYDAIADRKGVEVADVIIDDLDNFITNQK